MDEGSKSLTTELVQEMIDGLRDLERGFMAIFEEIKKEEEDKNGNK